jgi:hypothetical protein
MVLGRVTPEPPDFDLYTFICPECEYVRSVAVETGRQMVFERAGLASA